MPRGTVKWYDRDKGYGFIKADEGYDIYFDVSSIMGSGSRALFKSDEVTFSVGSGKKGPMAVRVKIERNPCSVNKNE